MKHTATACAAMMLLTMGVQTAHAQRATISPSSASGTEAETLEFVIGGNWKHNAEIEYRVVGRTATEDEDFAGISGDLCSIGTEKVEDWCPTGGQRAPYTVPVLHYTEHPNVKEGNETYRVEAWVTRYETGAIDSDGRAVIRECPSGCGRATATGTIIDSYEPELPAIAGTVGFPNDQSTLNEGESTRVTIRFVPDESPHGAGSVQWETAGATARAGDDFTEASGTFRIRACASTTGCGNQETSVTVRTRDDDVREDNEEFAVELSNTDGVEFRVSLSTFHLITIRDDDTANANPTVRASASPTSVDAGGTVELTATASDEDGTVTSYAWTGAGTFADANAASTTWTAPSPAVETQYTLTVTATDNEGGDARATARVTVAAATAQSGTEAGDVGFTSRSSTVDEGDSATIAIRFVPGESPHQAGSVKWRTQPGTAKSDDGDYTHASGSFNIQACTATSCGNQEHEIAIRTRDDSVHETGDEDFRVELHDASEVRIGQGLHSITIEGGCGSSSSTPNRGLWEPLGGFWERHSEEVSDPSTAWWGRVARRGADRQYYPISTSLGVRTRRCSALRGSASTHQDRDWLVAEASEPPRLQPHAGVRWSTPSDHGSRRCRRRRSDTCVACPGVGQLDDDVQYHTVTSTSYTAAVARSSGVSAPPMSVSGAQPGLS